MGSRAWTAVLAAGLAAPLAGCGGGGPPPHRAAAGATPTTAASAPATFPPLESPDPLPVTGAGRRLGGWVLTGAVLVPAAVASQGLATYTPAGGGTATAYRGDLSISSRLQGEGWVHVGDPGSWRDRVFDAYEHAAPATTKMFEVTGPTGATRDYVHRLAPGEMANNSFAAITPDGRWLVAGEWGTTTRLLVFPTPGVNPAAPPPAANLPLAGTITLDHQARDIQGCAFVAAARLVCTSDDPGSGLWPEPDPLLEVDLAAPLAPGDVVRGVPGRVSSLGQVPLVSTCRGAFEPEGVDYQAPARTLRVEVIPPGTCAAQVAVYSYRPAP